MSRVLEAHSAGSLRGPQGVCVAEEEEWAALREMRLGHYLKGAVMGPGCFVEEFDIMLGMLRFVFLENDSGCREEDEKEKTLEAGRLIRRPCRNGEILGVETVIGFGKVRIYLRNSNLELMGTGNQWDMGMRYKLKMALYFVD